MGYLHAILIILVFNGKERRSVIRHESGVFIFWLKKLHRFDASNVAGEVKANVSEVFC